MRTLTCFCERKFDVNFPELVDLSKNPETEQHILEGTFMSAICPACGKLLKPEFPVKLIGLERGLDLFFIPELDRSTYYRGGLKYKIKDCRRLVIGYAELVEKIKLNEQHLDDEIVEIIKYYLLGKALEDVPEEREIRILFQEIQGEELIFHIQGLKPEEVGILRVSKTMFDKVSAQRQAKKTQEPITEILTPPYV